MRDVERQLLFCLAAYRLGRGTAELENGFADWAGLHRLADAHKLSPVVCETLWRRPEFCGGEEKLAAAWRQQTILQAAGQAGRTQRLLALTGPLEAEGIRYAVVKGALCRALYTRPDLRLSGDEDLLVHEEDAARCAEIFAENGMKPMNDLPDGPVTHWLDRRTGLHIELHTELFSSKRPADRLLNGCFHEQLAHTVLAPAEGGTLCTFSPTYHFLFLVCHALKHFIAGGFGIRTLCDVVTYAERHRGEIDRRTVYDWLERVDGRVFLDQMFAIGQEYLSFSPDESGWPLTSAPDAGDMLADILDAGIYGQSTMSRRHSAGTVLRAAEQGSGKGALLRTAFPSADELHGRYPVLKRAPALLPAVWLHRFGRYGLELLHGRRADNSLRDSVALGKKRTEMMRKYGILPKGKKENR